MKAAASADHDDGPVGVARGQVEGEVVAASEAELAFGADLIS